MRPLFQCAGIRELERRFRHLELMKRAASAAVAWLVHRFAQQPITLLVGPGNNGGDALLIGQQLASRGWPVSIYAPLGLPEPRTTDGTVAVLAEEPCTWPALVIDGLFGIGLARPIDGQISQLFERISRSGATVVALDVPSGLDADTGRVLGHALRASYTLGFIADKPGLYTAEGRDFSGEIHSFDLGLNLPEPQVWLDDVRPACLEPRYHNSHKGRHGTVAILGGASGMAGAALLAGRAALLAGAGRVRLGLLEPAFPVDAEWPELMVTDGSELFAHTHDVYAIGPGLGTSQAATTILRRVLALPHPLVIDADALNLIAIHAELQHALCARDAATVLTPHPAEAARLLALTTNEIQNDRITAGRALVQRLNVVVVLKGSGTLTAHHEGMWINGSGNGALGVAGQGDVLTGLIAALLAQGLSPLKACRLGVFVHGQAGDQWRQGQPNGIGLRAMETALLARDLLNQLS
ncbi:NAD(P)H-hydrate dehydratase [Chitinibacteraceae bacterium HSL-7]